jgi:hypothetical protein
MNDLREFDHVTVSGYCLSEGRFFYHLPCVIASHGPMYDNEIKMWPLEPMRDGKLWFRLRTLRIHKHQRFL